MRDASASVLLVAELDRARGPGGPRSVSAVVPQKLLARSGSERRAGDNHRTVSKENVALIRGTYEGFLAGDSEFDADGTLTRLNSESLWDPDIELDASMTGPHGETLPDAGGIYRGVDAVRGWWREWLTAWELIDFDYELVDAGDSVVALIDQKMRARSSGIEVPFGRYAQVVTLRDNLIVRWKFYLSQAEALKAAGVSS